MAIKTQFIDPSQFTDTKIKMDSYEEVPLKIRYLVDWKYTAKWWFGTCRS